MKTINGQNISAKKFAFDDCHKIYLLNNINDLTEAKKLGYTIYSIEDLIECFIYSCSLRFIGVWGGNFKNIVNQFEKHIEFVGFSIPSDMTSFEYKLEIVGNKLNMENIVCE